MGRVKRIWYLSPMRASKVQASLRIRAVSPEPSLLAHTSSESRETFRQKARSLAPLNGWACAVKICHDGMLEDTNSLDGAPIFLMSWTWSGLSTDPGKTIAGAPALGLIFFFGLVLQPVKIISLILSWVNRKVGGGGRKRVIPEKKHLATHKQNLACLACDPS